MALSPLSPTAAMVYIYDRQNFDYMLLLNRQKVLMLVLEELNSRGISSKTFLEKVLFLLKN